MNRSLKYPISRYAYIALVGVFVLIVLIVRGYPTAAWNEAIGYHVNPLIFLVLLLATAPFYYWSWYRVLKSGAQRNWREFRREVVMNRVIWAPPWVYVYIVGSNYPWWVRPAIASWAMVAAVMVIVRVRSSKPIHFEGD